MTYTKEALLDAVNYLLASAHKDYNSMMQSTQTNMNVSPLDVQVAGDHYKTLAIQPVEYIHANGLGYFEGNVLKYITRWKAKNGLADLQKAKHYIELLIALEFPPTGKPEQSNVSEA